MRFKPLSFTIALLGTIFVYCSAPARATTIAIVDPVKPYEIVAFGDSLSAGYKLPQEASFSGQLQTKLRENGHEVNVNNGAVSGDTTSGGFARLDWSIPDSTDLVILELGANDALRGIPVALTKKNLEGMIKRLKERNIKVLLAGMLAPPNMGEAYEGEFNVIFPELAKSNDVVLYPFFLDGVAGEQELLLDDGMHPNARGVERIVEGILPLIENEISTSH